MRQSALALLMAAVLVMPARAQQNPQTREGFWISFGIGYGSLGCDDCGDERESGTSAHLSMGGTLTQRLLIGGEINGWSKTENDATLTVGNFGPVLLFYPNPNGGLFLKGGVGMATARLDFGSFDANETGVGITIGIGYDARVGRNFALTPFFDILAGNFDFGDTNQFAWSSCQEVCKWALGGAQLSGSRNEDAIREDGALIDLFTEFRSVEFAEVLLNDE